MIRKTLFFTIAVLILLWLTGAYYLKNKVVSFLDSATIPNSSFNYKNINIGGFPFSWRVKVVEPRFTMTTQEDLAELDFTTLTVDFNYSLNKIRIIFPQSAQYKLNQAGKTMKTIFKTDQNYSFDIDLQRSIYRDNLTLDLGRIKKINCDIPKLISLYENEVSSFNHQNSFLLQIEVKEDRVKINNQLVIEKDPEIDNTISNTITSVINLDFTIINSANPNDFKVKCDVNKYSFKGYNEISKEISFSAHGNVILSLLSDPIGKLQIEMLSYEQVIDAIAPEHPAILKPRLKNFIAKAVMTSLGKLPTNEDKIDFDVIFSEQGIMVGDLYLIDFRK